MKTSVNDNDEALRQVRDRVKQEETIRARPNKYSVTTLTVPQGQELGLFKLKLHTVKGVQPPVIDIFDREALYDLLDGE